MGKTPLWLQCQYAFGKHSIPIEVGEGGLEGTQSSWIQLQLLKSKEVDDVRRATVVHEDSPGVEPLYHKHYNQRVVM